MNVKTGINRNTQFYQVGEAESVNNASATGVGTVTLRISHNLGYIPKFVAFVSEDNITYHRMSYLEVGFDGTYFWNKTDNAYANEVELVFEFQYVVGDGFGVGGPATVPNKYVKYYIFRERVK